jgi:hypothetical protein
LSESDTYPGETSRPLLKELNGGNAHCKDANDSLDRTEDNFRIHGWLSDRMWFKAESLQM